MASATHGKVKAKKSPFSLIGIIMMVLALPFGAAGWFSIKSEQEYEARGVIVTGEILGRKIEEKWDKERKSTTKSYYINYKFNAPGGLPMEATDGVSSEIYDAAQTGNKIDIQVISDNPSKNRVAAETDYVFGIVFCGVASVIFLVGATIFYFDFKRKRLFTRLQNEGILVEATIRQVNPSNLCINDVTQWQLEYEFRDNQGNQRIGKSGYMSPQEAKAYENITKGKVRYDRSNSAISVWVG